MSHEIASIDARTTRDNYTAVPGARPFPENSEWIDLGRVVYYPDVNLAFIKRGPLDAPYHAHTKMHAISLACDLMTLDEMTQRVCGEENTLPEIFEKTYHNLILLVNS